MFAISLLMPACIGVRPTSGEDPVANAASGASLQGVATLGDSRAGSVSEYTPMQAVFAAAEKLEGVTGTFRFVVKGAGRQDGWLFLNSEEDYRDQRCLTVAVPPAAAIELERRLGGDPTVEMKGKDVRINGTAQRTTIWFYSNLRRTDKYYYQTQIRLTDLSQLRTVSGDL